MVTSVHVLQNTNKNILIIPTARNHKGELVQIDKPVRIEGSLSIQEIGVAVCSSIKIAEMGLVDDANVDVLKRETSFGAHESGGSKWKYLLLVFNSGKDEKLPAGSTIKSGYSIFKRVNKKIKGFWISENKLVGQLPLNSTELVLGETILNALTKIT